MQLCLIAFHHHYEYNLNALPPLSSSTSPSPSPSPSPLPLPSPSPSVVSRAHKMVFHTAFYWGKAHQILFPGWPGSSTGMYVLAVFFVFSLAILVECLSYYPFVNPGSNRVASCFFRTGLRTVRAGVAYMLILAAMSYNVGIFVAAVVGHSVGYLIFGSGLCLKKNGLSSSDVGIGPSKI